MRLKLHMTFWERVDNLLVQGQSTSWLAKQIKVPSSTINSARSRKSLPPVDTGCKIAKVLGVSVEYLVTGKDPYEEIDKEDEQQQSAPEKVPRELVVPSGKTITYDNEEVVLIPILSHRVSAGSGQDWNTEPLEGGETLPILKRLFKLYPKDSLRVVEVRGDSMTGINLLNGDLAIFAEKLIGGDGIYVIAIHGDLYIKRVEFDPIDQTIRIISENEQRQIKTVPADSDIIRLCGKVIGWVHSHPY